MPHSYATIAAVLAAVAVLALLFRSDLLIRASGADPKTARSDNDTQRAAIAGALVIGTTGIGALAMAGALSIALPHTPLPVRLLANTVWAFLLFNIDRWLVHTMGGRRLVGALTALLRMGLAAVIGLFVSGTLMLLLYSSEIGDQLHADHGNTAAARAAQDRTTSAAALDEAKQVADIAAQNTLKTNATTTTTAASAAWDAEANGTGGTHSFGDGAHAAQRLQDLNAAKSTEATIDSAANTQIASDQQAVTVDEASINLLVAGDQTSADSANGLAARQQALSEVLAHSPGARTEHLALLLLAIGVDITPALFALTSKPTRAQQRQSQQDILEDAAVAAAREAARNSPVLLTAAHTALGHAGRATMEAARVDSEDAIADAKARSAIRADQRAARSQRASQRRASPELLRLPSFRVSQLHVPGRPARVFSAVGAAALVALLLTTQLPHHPSGHTDAQSALTATPTDATAAAPAAATTPTPSTAAPAPFPAVVPGLLASDAPTYCDPLATQPVVDLTTALPALALQDGDQTQNQASVAAGVQLLRTAASQMPSTLQTAVLSAADAVTQFAANPTDPTRETAVETALATLNTQSETECHL